MKSAPPYGNALTLLMLVGLMASAQAQHIDPAPRTSKTPLSVCYGASPADAFATSRVLSDPKKSAILIASLRENSVRRVYGDYFKPGNNPHKIEQLKCWNRILDSLGVSSIYLTGSARWVLPPYRSGMLLLITKSYINFNHSVGEKERLKGLQLDIKPHLLPEWTTGSREQRRLLLEQLKETYRDARQLLAENGMGHHQIMATIPYWYCQLDIAWSSEDDRQAWFNEVATYLNGLTIMDCGSRDIAQLVSRTQWYRENFRGTVETELDADDVGLVWKSQEELLAALDQIAAATHQPVALHQYAAMLKRHEQLHRQMAGAKPSSRRAK